MISRRRRNRPVSLPADVAFQSVSQSIYLLDILSRDYNWDSTTIRLRHDYDEKLTCSFFARVEWRRMEACARDMS